VTFALGIDVGTSGVRTAVLDGEDNPVSFASHDHVPQPDPDRIDATLWWEAVRACLRQQVTRLRDTGIDPRQVTRLAVDGTSGTMVLVDRTLRPVTRALMYNSGGFDREAGVIASIAPKAHITQGKASALARAMHLAHEDDTGRAAHLLHQADFITAKLAGRALPSDANNALKTGYDPEEGAWPAWIEKTGFDPGLLPEVTVPGAELGVISPEVAVDLGLSSKAVIHAGTTDSIAAYLACARPELGVAVTSIGTTLAVKVMSNARIDDPAMGLYAHRLGEGWLVGGASNTGGGVLRHYFTVDELVALSDRIDPHTHSPLDYYPLLKPGERFPINDPDLEPRISPRPASDADFLHGLFEGMARIEALCYQRIKDAGGVAPTKIFTAGGAAGNRVFEQIRARHLPIPPQRAKTTDAAIGTARLCRLG